MEKILLQFYFAMQKYLYPQIDKQTFNALIDHGKVLESDETGVKVIEIEGQKIVKFFRLKRVFSSAFFFPYAWRFKRNAEQLKAKGIKTITVSKIEYCLDEQRHILTYEKILGQTIKDSLIKENNNADLINQLIVFIAKLHNKGVYFRSLHFGNVVVAEDGQMALIDIVDLKIFSGSLSFNHRIRNWKHLLKYTFEKNVIAGYESELFFDAYAKGYHLSGKHRKRLKELLMLS